METEQALTRLGDSVRMHAESRRSKAAVDALTTAKRASERGDRDSAKLWRQTAATLLEVDGHSDLAMSLVEAEEMLADL